MNRFKDIELIDFVIGLTWAMALMPILVIATQLAMYQNGLWSEPSIYSSKTQIIFVVVYAVFVIANLVFALHQWGKSKSTKSQDKSSEDNKTFFRES